MKIIRQYLDRSMYELDEDDVAVRDVATSEETAKCLPKSLKDIPSDPGDAFHETQLRLARPQAFLGQAAL